MTCIVVEGVIGSGETALVCLLGRQLGVRTFFEQFDENPFLNSLTLCDPPGGMSACFSRVNCI